MRVGNQPSSPGGCVPGSIEEAGGQRDQALAGGSCEAREGLSTSPQCVTRALYEFLQFMGGTMPCNVIVTYRGP